MSDSTTHIVEYREFKPEVIDGIITKLYDHKQKFIVPKFVKMYMGTMAHVAGLTRTAAMLLDFFLNRMDERNEVQSNRTVWKEFNDHLARFEIKPHNIQTIKNRIQELKEAGFIIPKERGVYILNPEYFTTMDEMERMKKIRFIIEMEVTAKMRMYVEHEQWPEDKFEEAVEIIAQKVPEGF